MNTGAELTLQIVRLAQSHASGDVARARPLWLFWPHGERRDWEGARELLGHLAKPVLVAPLVEPGMLGLWTVDMLDAAHRPAVERQISNQVQYFADKLAALKISQGPVRFGSDTSAYEMTRDEFLQWATEHMINLGLSLQRSADGSAARVLVLPSRGGAPPLTL